MKVITWLILLVNFVHVAMAEECQLPVNLVGKKVLLHIYGVTADTNPYANSMIEMHFNKKTYQLVILDTGDKVNGTYSYQRYEPDLAELRMEEKKKINNEEFITYYTETLVCQTNLTGLYIFNGIKGAINPKVRQNPGRYFFNQID